MSNTYEEFAAAAFGPVLADWCREKDEQTVSEESAKAAAEAWNLTARAFQAVVDEANRLLASE